MAFYHNLSYATDHLKIYLDAGNTSSYPGSGTVWTDLSGNNYNFLVEAAAYTNAYNGNSSQVKYMNFGGSYGCAKTSTGALYNISDSNGITIICWTRILDNTTTWRTLLRGVGTGNNDHQIIVGPPGAYQMGMYDNVNTSGFNDSGFTVQNLPGYPTIGSIPNTNSNANTIWTMMVWKFQPTSPYYQFQIDNNPTVLGQNTSSNARFKSGISSLGAYGNDILTDVTNASQYWGDIAIFMLYDKVLTQAEINQNFDTFAPRFNGGTDVSAGNSIRQVGVFPGIVPLPDSYAPGSKLMSNGTSGFWSYPGNTNGNPQSGLQYRSIFTHGYLAGGYKGSNPWRAVNRTWHATDITMYCGEQLAYAANYIEGTFSDYNGYVHNTADAYSTASAGTQSYSLANGTLRARGSGTYSPPGTGFGYPPDTGTSGLGGWNLDASRGTTYGASVNQIGQIGYITGGGSATTDKFFFPTETMFTTTAAPVAGGMTSGCHGSSNGYFSIAGNRQYIAYSTDVWAAWSGSASPDGWCKILSSKLGYHYAGNGGNVTIGLVKFSDVNGSDISTLSKIRACGEENLQMGQNHGYMLGNYDNQQNNQTVKYNYLNDQLTQLGVGAQPKGHFGQSSGTCSSAAASVTNSNSSVGY